MPQDVERTTKRQDTSASESLMQVKAFDMKVQVVIDP
jgi:hypothetical protein